VRHRGREDRSGVGYRCAGLVDRQRRNVDSLDAGSLPPHSNGHAHRAASSRRTQLWAVVPLTRSTRLKARPGVAAGVMAAQRVCHQTQHGSPTVYPNVTEEIACNSHSKFGSVRCKKNQLSVTSLDVAVGRLGGGNLFGKDPLEYRWTQRLRPIISDTHQPLVHRLSKEGRLHLSCAVPRGIVG
jgi:hypothetical protein